MLKKILTFLLAVITVLPAGALASAEKPTTNTVQTAKNKYTFTFDVTENDAITEGPMQGLPYRCLTYSDPDLNVCIQNTYLLK